MHARCIPLSSRPSPGRVRASRVRWRAALTAVLLAAAAGASAQGTLVPCGSLENAYGPLDYRTDRDKLGIVEMAHFTTEVELLITGKGGYLGGDIDYTLRAFPNHHRALISMMRYGEKSGLPQVPYARYTVECYFVRALRFRPDDTTARMIYAMFLHSKKRDEEALHQLEAVRGYAGDNPLTIHNLGMVYFDVGAYDKSLEAAHAAIALGFDRPDLRERLAKVGKWRDPVPAPAAAASSPDAVVQ